MPDSTIFRYVCFYPNVIFILFSLKICFYLEFYICIGALVQKKKYDLKQILNSNLFHKCYPKPTYFFFLGLIY